MPTAISRPSTRSGRRRARRRPPPAELTEAVAKNLFKLMAYKDEYEVARLYTDGSFAKKLSDKFDGDFQLKFYLAPPIFAQRDKIPAGCMKKEYGGWMLSAFGWLAKLKFLRGTAFDPFGRTAERKTERQADRGLSRDDRPARRWAEARANSACWRRLARIPETIRGYGHVKEENIKKAAAERARLEGDLENSRFAAAAE